MKYNLIPSESSDSADSIYIYILPSSFEGSNYSIAYSDYRTEDILNDRFLIRTFDGCSPMAFKEIETELRGKLSKKYEKYVERLNTFFTTGIVVFILGIVNWVIPDPLPLVDELIFTVVGGITAWKAWKDRKVKLPVFTEQIYRYGYDNFKPEVEIDILLTTIFNSIRCKINPKEAGDITKNMDTIDIESLWMTKYLNFQDLAVPGNSNFGDLIKVLENVLFVKEIIKLEKRKQSKRLRRRLINLKQETINKTGINQDVLAVYIEFYRLYLIYKTEG